MNGYGRDLKIKEWWELINKWLNLIIIYTLKFLLFKLELLNL